MQKAACRLFGVLIVVLLCGPNGWGKERLPSGKLAASVDDVVVLADPVNGLTETISAGPVAWLYPAPGGILFAPDLVHGRTTVVNLRSGRVVEVLEGVTMPHFGERTDRYMVVGRDVMTVSYPERALIKKYDVSIEHPWQVEILAYNTVLMVLERRPDGSGGSVLTALNLDGGDVVYRHPLDGDVPHMAFSGSLGVMALADASSDRVILVDPGSLDPVAAFEVPGAPADVVFAEDGTTLVAVFARADGSGALAMWKIKAGRKSLEAKKQWMVELAGRPVRMAASPDLHHVAVALESAAIQVIEVATRRLGTTVELPASPRDLAWCDPSLPGPLLPEWSDAERPRLDLGGVQ